MGDRRRGHVAPDDLPARFRAIYEAALEQRPAMPFDDTIDVRALPKRDEPFGIEAVVVMLALDLVAAVNLHELRLGRASGVGSAHGHVGREHSCLGQTAG